MRQPLGTVVAMLSAIKISLLKTLAALGSAARHRRASEFASLLSEGSPLENLIDSLAATALWVLALAPVLLVPIYYLLMSLK